MPKKNPMTHGFFLPHSEAFMGNNCLKRPQLIALYKSATANKRKLGLKIMAIKCCTLGFFFPYRSTDGFHIKTKVCVIAYFVVWNGGLSIQSLKLYSQSNLGEIAISYLRIQLFWSLSMHGSDISVAMKTSCGNSRQLIRKV